jgi:putative pyruvate formate lyase activating enzyme
VASFQSHFGEESPLVGVGGSGTIFFSSCNLLCSFCQNYEISHLRKGDLADKDELAAMMVALQRRGCHNINLVSPTHVVPQILEALVTAFAMGLTVPLVYNTGGYDTVETLQMLEGVVDIYMPDFKFWDDRWGERFCHVPDYRERACAAIQEMRRQVGDLVIGPDGIARRGLLVRHLVMPDGIAGTEDIMRFLAEEISPATYVNIMAQYHPAGRAMGDPAIARRISRREFDLAVAAARKAGLRRLDGVRE